MKIRVYCASRAIPHVLPALLSLLAIPASPAKLQYLIQVQAYVYVLWGSTSTTPRAHVWFAPTRAQPVHWLPPTAHRAQPTVCYLPTPAPASPSTMMRPTLLLAWPAPIPARRVMPVAA